MQKSFDRSLWKESDIEEKQRDLLNQQSTPEDVRKLFPFKARARMRLAPYGIPEGTIFEYARARMSVNTYPIQAIIGVAGDVKNPHPRLVYLTSQEAQLLEV